ncbi:hypothetical protein BH10BAC2_BH10BAC2_07600 [soil metagenome]
MKKLIISVCFLSMVAISFAQEDFKTQMATAKTSYAAGNLEDAHFALQQAMQELDIIIGKEVLKLLPVKLDSLAMNTKDDHVTANAGFIGATIHRSYGTQNKAQIEIINNSPLIGTLNTFLNSALLGGMMRDENTKVVKVQGYKSRLEKQGDNENGKFNYNLQIPFNSALMTFTVNGATEAEVLAMVNTMPLQNIAKLIQ